MALTLKQGRKVVSAEDAAGMINDGDCITISGTTGWMLPQKILNALEVRFLSENSPRDLTWFEPFPTGVAGIEPLSYPGLLKRVIGGWYTPHPRLREMIVANDVEAYLYPLGSLSFLCQAMAAGRDMYLTKVGIDTYVDPRQGGGKLNERATEDLVSLETVSGETFLKYKQLPITAALIRGSVVDESGNLSIATEQVTMNVVNQALAAKRFGGKVLVQARKIVPTGSIPAREVTIPGALVDAIVIDPDQNDDDNFPDLNWLSPWDRLTPPPAQVLTSPEREGWARWVQEGVVDERLAPPVRPIYPDNAVARRAARELTKGAVVNIGQGLPAREILPVTLSEGIQPYCALSIETGHLGGVVNGIGFRANTTSILDTPTIFSLYGSALVSCAFFSMLEFDRAGNVNLLRYGDTWVGPGGSMDIAHAVDKVVFCGTFRAGGLSTNGTGGKLHIENEGGIARAVEQVQAICFNGRQMSEQGKEVLYVTERAVFQLTSDGIELIEIAPGVDLERDIVDKMQFKPTISPNLREMPAEVFTPGPMGMLEAWEAERPAVAAHA